MATKKYYRVPECSMVLSLATHPGKLTVQDVQSNIFRVLKNTSQKQEECWVHELEKHYWQTDQGILPWSMQRPGGKATEEEWEQSEDETEMWTMADRLTGEPGNYIMDEANEFDRGKAVKEAAGVGETLEEITSPEDLEELEETLEATVWSLIEALPDFDR
jgi:hypothetical protein